MKKIWSVILSLCILCGLCDMHVSARVDPVAQVGSSTYASLDDAIAAANGSTVTLLGDVNYGQIQGDAITIPAGNNVTLDLNGFTIRVSTASLTQSAGFLVNFGTLTVKDSSTAQNGKIAYNASVDLNWSYGTYIIDNRGTFNMESGALEMSGLNGISYCIQNNSNAAAAPVANIKGGTLSCNSDAIRLFAYSATQDNIVNISGGTITAHDGGAVWIQDPSGGKGAYKASVNISGGTLVSDLSDAILIYSTKTNSTEFKVSVTGGTFSDFTAVKYLAASAAITVKPVADLTVSALVTIPAGNTVSLDLNGKTVTLHGAGARILKNLGTLAITGNGGTLQNDTAGNGTATGTASYGLIDNYGTLTADGVSFKDVGCGDGAALKLRPSGSSSAVLTNCTVLSTGVSLGNACIFSEGTLTVNGGSFTNSSTGAYSVIVNSGSCTMNSYENVGPVVVGQHGGFGVNSGEATVNAGSYKGINYYGIWVSNDGDNTEVTIQDAVVEGGVYGLRANVDDGQQDAGNVSITINGGSFKGGTASAVVLNQSETVRSWGMEITGGAYSTDPSAYLAAGYTAVAGTAPYLYRVGKLSENRIESATAVVKTGTETTAEDVSVAVAAGTLTVSGQISGGNTVTVTYTCTDGKTGTITVTGQDSVFTADPTSVTVGSTAYTVDVSGLKILPAKVEVAAPAAEAAVEGTPTNVEGANDAKNAIQEHTENISASGLGAAVTAATISTQESGTVVNVTVGTGTNGEAEVKTAAEVIAAAQQTTGAEEILGSDTESLIVVVQPVLSIAVKDVVEKDGSKILMLDVSAKSQTVVVQESKAGTEIVTEGPNANAVAVGEPVTVTVNTPVTMTIPVPEGFVEAGNEENLFVDHEMHDGSIETVRAYYNAEQNTITFTVHGMSPMNIKTDVRKGTVNYPDETCQVYRLSEVGSSLPVLEKDGFSFTGWIFTGIEGIHTTLTDSLLTALSGKEVAAEAQYLPIYTVSFNTNGIGTAPEGQQVVSGQKATAPVVSDVSGYAFDGWYREEACVNAWDFSADSVSEAVVLYAKWLRVYSVTQGNGQTVEPGKPAEFAADGNAGALLGIQVDGKDVPESSYTVKDGFVTLSSAYLDSLTEGEHSLTFVYSDGTATAAFTGGTNHNTGNTGTAAFLVVLLMVSGAACGFLFLNRKKKYYIHQR